MKRWLIITGFLWMLWGWLPATAQIPGLDSLDLDTGGTQSKLPDIQFVNPSTPEQEVEAIRSLFDREDWKFNQDTLEQAVRDIRSVPTQLDNIRDTFTSTDIPLSWMIGIGAGTLIFLVLGYWSDRKLGQAASHILQWVPTGWTFWLRRSIKVLVVVLSQLLFPLAVLIVLHVGWEAFPQDHLYFPLFIDGALLFLVYRCLQTLLYEVFYSEQEHLLENTDAGSARKIYHRFHYFLLFSALLWFGIFVFQDLNYREDFIELLIFIYSVSLFGFAGYMLSRKREIFGLFPNIDEPFYQRFLFFLRRFYTYVSGFTLLLGALWIAGYRPLVNILFLRSWAIVGLILGVRLLHRAMVYGIEHYFTDEKPEDSRLVQRVIQTATVIEVVVLSHSVLALLGLRGPLIGLLDRPIATIGDKSVISPLSFVNGVISLGVVWLITRIVLAFLEERVYPKRFDVGIQQMINLTVFYVLMAVGILIALNVVGLDLSVFTIFAGALAFGVGFGLQGIAKNFVSGIILIFTGLVKKGDLITVSDHSGYIQDVSWKNVHLRTTDHVDLIIPTVDLVESPIVNWSYSGNVVRMHVPVGVSYNSDMKLVKKVLLNVAREHAEVKTHPTPAVWMTGFGDSAVNFEILVWVDCRRITRERLMGELNFAIWNALAENQIEIPFPQRDLHVRSVAPEILERTESHIDKSKKHLPETDA